MMKQETKSMSDEVSEYREYVDVVRQIEPPRARIGDMELLSQTIAIWRSAEA